MGNIALRDAQGRLRGFTIAGTTPSPAEQQRINAILLGQPPAPATPPEQEMGIMSTLRAGLGRGVDSAQAGLFTAGEGLAHAADDGKFLGRTEEDYRKLADEQRAQRDAIQIPQEGFFEAEGAYNKIRSLAGTMGESLPAMAAGAAATIGGGVVGGPVGALAGGAAAAAMYAPQALNENAERQIAEHGRIKDWDKALAATGASVAVEAIGDRLTLGVAGVLKKPLSKVMKEAIQTGKERALTIAAKRIGGTAAVSTLSGATEEAIQSIATRWQAEQDLGSPEANAEYLEAAVVGGILEGVFGAGAGAMGARADVKNRRAHEAAEQYVADEAASLAIARDAARDDYEASIKSRMADYADPVDTSDVKIAGLLKDRSAERTAVQTHLNQEENRVPEGLSVSPEPEVQGPLFTEAEYLKAIETLRDEKLVAPDKIKTKMKIGRPKADALYQALLERNDAAPVGSRGQYLKVTTPKGMATKTGSDATGSLNEGVQRDYIVRPVDDAGRKPYNVYFKGKKRGKGFQTAEEAQSFAEKTKLKGAEIRNDGAKDQQFGIYEVHYRKAKDGQEEVVGKKVVNTFRTQAEANEAIKEYDPAYSPDSPRWMKRYTQEEKYALAKADVDRELGVRLAAQTEKLQEHVDRIAGPGKVEARVVDRIEAPDRPDLVIEGQQRRETTEKGLRHIIEVSGDLFSEQAGIDQVGTHEVLHALRSLDILTKAEWDRLYKKQLHEKVPGQPFTWAHLATVRAKGVPDAILAEESIAEMMRFYQKNPTALDKPTRSLIGKLFDFIRKLVGLSKRHAGDDVIRAILGGEMASRPVGSGGLGDRKDAADRFWSAVKVPPFYMKSAKVIENAKLPKGTSDQWLGLLRNAQIKKEEMDWLGIEDWLKGQKTPAKEDVLNFIKANSLDVKERIAASDVSTPRYRELQDKLINIWSEEDSPLTFEEWIDLNAYPSALTEDVEALKEQANAARQRAGKTYHDYTTQDGGSGYTELVFHMPTLQPQFIKSAHFDGFPNIIMHARFKTRDYGDGKKVLFIEEIQSDLHQQGKKKGYVTGADAAHAIELQERKRALDSEWRELGVRRRASDDWDEQFRLSEQQKAVGSEINSLIGKLVNLHAIPDAPLKTTWDEYAFKRLVRYAAENGFDAVAWHGEPDSVALTEKYGAITEHPMDEEGDPLYTNDPDAKTGWFAGTEQEIGQGYTQNVTGVMDFYLRRLRGFSSKFFKKWGATVQKINPNPEGETNYDYDAAFPTINDLRSLVSYAEAADAGLGRNVRLAAQIAANQRRFDPRAAFAQTDVNPRELFRLIEDLTGDGGETDIDSDARGNPLVARWQMNLTPELKRSALEEGFPLFSAVSTQRMAEIKADPNFQRWFANSAVVDDDGDPLVVYHGTQTQSDFDKFRHLSHFGTLDAAQDRLGVVMTEGSTHWGDSARIEDMARKRGVVDDEMGRFEIADEANEWWEKLSGAERYAIVSEDYPERAEQSRIYPVFLSIQNPLRINDDGILENWKDLADQAHYNEAITWEEAQEVKKKPFGHLIELLESKGYDGFVYENTVEDRGSDSYIPFHPEQVKSVYNRGTWSKEDRRINYSAVAVPQYSATAPMGQRVPANPSADRLAEIEAKITYNNLAPQLQKLGAHLPVKFQRRFHEGVEDTLISLQDRMLPVAKLIDRMKKNGDFITNENDVYLREQLFSGQTDAALQDNKRKFYDPLIAAVDALPVTKDHAAQAAKLNDAAKSIITEYVGKPRLGLAELYLYARHAEERNAVMRERNAPLIGERPDQYQSGSGMSDLEAQTILRWFDAQPFGRKFSDLSDPNSVRSMFRKLISSTNDIRAAGQLTPDFRKKTRADGRPANLYEDYAPLRSIVDEHADPDADVMAFAKAGKGFNIRGHEDPSALGRRSLAANVIANAVLQNEEATLRAGKNAVGLSFVKLIRDNPDATSDVAKIIQSKPVKYGLDRKRGVVRRVPDNSMRNDPLILTVKERVQDPATGEDYVKEVYIKFKDERIARAMNQRSSLGNAGGGNISKALLKLNRFLGAARTSYNPEFMISNMLRDLETALGNLTEYEMQGLRKEIVASLPSALKGVYQGQRTGDMSKGWAKTFDEFRKRGGMTAFMGIRDLEDTIKNTNKALSTDASGVAHNALKPIKALGGLIEDLNLAVENGIRLSAYKALTDRFLSMTADPKDPKNIRRAEEQAAAAAKRLTVNFNMGGEMKPLLNAWYLFFNASMQGSMALVNPFIRSKKVRKLWGAVLLAGLTQDLLMSMISPEDDDGEKVYDKIPDYILESNLVFMDVFGLTERGYFKVPMPYLMNGIYNAGRALSRGMRGGYTPGEAFNSVTGTLVESLNPFGSGGNAFLNFVAPTVMDPFVDLYTNKKFSGAPISPPENPFGVSEKDSQRYWNNTNPLYVTVADWLSTLSGSDGDYLGGKLEFSPNTLEYWVDFAVGGAGPFAVRAISSPWQATTGSLEEINDVPFLRRVYGNITAKNDLQQFIASRDKVMAVRAELKEAQKNGDAEHYTRIISQYPEEYRLASRISKIENARKKISGQIKKVRENKGLSEERKQEIIRLLKERQDELVGMGNSLMKEIP